MKSIITLAFAMLISILISIPSFADIQISPQNVMFGRVKVGSFGYNQQVVYIRNIGKEVTRLQITGYCGADFNVSNTCYSLPAYGTCNIRVSFKPTRAGYLSCSLNVREQSGFAKYINISGTGVK